MAFGFKLTEVRGVRDTAGCRQAAKHVSQSLLRQSPYEPSADDSLELPLQQPDTAAWQTERQKGMLLPNACCTPFHLLCTMKASFRLSCATAALALRYNMCVACPLLQI